MTQSNVRRDQLIFAASLALVIGLFIFLGVQLHVEDGPLAFDWKIIWHSIRNGSITYGNGLYNPPWALLFLLPLGFVPVQIGWGIFTFLTLATLVMSVQSPSPQAFWKRFVSILLVATAYPALRLYGDANVDALVILGIWLLVAGYNRRISWMMALGVLIATIKPQAVTLLLIILAVYCWQHLVPKIWIRAAGIVMVVVLISLLAYGGGWFDAISVGTLPSGISLPGLLSELDVPQGLIVLVQLLIGGITLGVALKGPPVFSTLKIGMLTVASMIVSPYTNGHGMVIAMALVAAPFLLLRPFLGVMLILLLDFPIATFISNSQASQIKLGYYWTGVLIIYWIVALVVYYRNEILLLSGENRKSKKS
ncbi:MAG: hypothetical protein H6673_02250 [Anaerolineales bacterium]|nr:hypothetical protein [Anaerolineales bacterium]